MEAGEATRPPDEAETPPTPLGCRGAVTPLLDRRTRDLFNRGATRHATAGFPSTRGNLNIEEHNPPHHCAPLLSRLEELLLSLELNQKNKRPPGRLLGSLGAPVFSVSAATD